MSGIGVLFDLPGHTMRPVGDLNVIIRSLEELVRIEPRILDAIREAPLGGHRFLTHPFRCLSDLGFELDDAVREELVRHTPALASCRDEPYDALVRGGRDTSVTIGVRRLRR